MSAVGAEKETEEEEDVWRENLSIFVVAVVAKIKKEMRRMTRRRRKWKVEEMMTVRKVERD